MFRLGWDVWIKSTANSIVLLNDIFVNRLVMSNQTKTLSTKLTRLGTSSNVKVSFLQYCSGRWGETRLRNYLAKLQLYNPTEETIGQSLGEESESVKLCMLGVS